MQIPDDPMTMPDVLQMFDITTGTLQTWRNQKGFPTIVIPGRARNTIRFEKKAVLAWAKKNGKTVVVEVARRNLDRLPKGLRTPEDKFYRLILQVLISMGGSGKMAEVLERVGETMKGTLRDVDYRPLGRSPDTVRWRNTAQFARNSMVKEGLLKADSPRGVWEVTDKGRASVK